jgi:hypothetical protein
LGVKRPVLDRTAYGARTYGRSATQRRDGRNRSAPGHHRPSHQDRPLTQIVPRSAFRRQDRRDGCLVPTMRPAAAKPCTVLSRRGQQAQDGVTTPTIAKAVKRAGSKYASPVEDVPQFLVLLCASWVQLNQDRGAFCLLSGNSSHVLPSRSLPAAFLFVPPHRFTTKARRHQESPGFFPFVSWSLGGEKNQVMDSEFPLANTLVQLGKGVLTIAEAEPNDNTKREKWRARKQRAPPALRPSSWGALQGHSGRG